MGAFFKRTLPFFILIGGIWEMLYQFHIWPPYLFPSLVRDVVPALLSGFLNRTFLIGTLVSLKRILIGYVLSLLIGIPLGLAVGRFKFLDETVGSFIGMLQVLPSICWLPLAILWFGLNEWAIQFVVIMGAFLPIAIATDGGIKNVPPLYLRAARTMGVRGFDLYRRVIFPAALPSILTGMKLGWSFAWRSLMAGELIFVSTGLGHLLEMGRELNDMSQVVAVISVIITLGLIVDRLLFRPVERRVHNRWGTAAL